MSAHPWLAACLACLCVGCVIDDTRGATTVGWLAPIPDTHHRLVALGSDYTSTTLSMLDSTTLTRIGSSFWHSGSAVSAATTALSGDCALGTRGDDGRIVVLDRSNAVISLLDPTTMNVRQIGVGTGFRANPQAWLPRPDGTAWVVRMGRNTAPTANPADMDEGDDLLVVQPETGTLTQRVALAPYASVAGLVAAPARLLDDGQHVWVSLQSLAVDFQSQGPARILRLSAAAPTIDATVDVPGLKNCMSMAVVTAERQILSVCPGAFSDKSAQATHAGIAIWPADAATPTAKVLYTAANLESTGTLGADLACLPDGDCLVIVPGSPDTGTRDALWRIHADGRPATRIGEGSGPFSLSGMWADTTGSRIFVGDRTGTGGDLRVWNRSGDKWTEGAPVATNPGSLGTIDVGVF